MIEGQEDDLTLIGILSDVYADAPFRVRICKWLFNFLKYSSMIATVLNEMKPVMLAQMAHLSEISRHDRALCKYENNS